MTQPKELNPVPCAKCKEEKIIFVWTGGATRRCECITCDNVGPSKETNRKAAYAWNVQQENEPNHELQLLAVLMILKEYIKELPDEMMQKICDIAEIKEKIQG